MTPFSRLHEQGSLCLPAAPRSPSLPPRAPGRPSSCSAPCSHTVALLELRHPRPRLLAGPPAPDSAEGPRILTRSRCPCSHSWERVACVLAELRSPAGHPLSQGDFKWGFWRPSLPCHWAHLDPPRATQGSPSLGSENGAASSSFQKSLGSSPWGPVPEQPADSEGPLGGPMLVTSTGKSEIVLCGSRFRLTAPPALPSRLVSSPARVDGGFPRAAAPRPLGRPTFKDENTQLRRAGGSRGSGSAPAVAEQGPQPTSPRGEPFSHPGGREGSPESSERRPSPSTQPHGEGGGDEGGGGHPTGPHTQAPL